MKIDIISDIHTDFWCDTNPQSPKFNKKLQNLISMLEIDKTTSDMLIIAGDLGHYFPLDSAFLLECKKYYKHILLVRGNHDMYLVSSSQQKKYLSRSTNRYLEMKRFCSNNDIHYLDGQVVCIDGYKFSGVGMSWDGSYYSQLIPNASKTEIKNAFHKYLNDGRYIMEGPSYRIPQPYGDSIFVSTFDQLSYFNNELKKLQNIPEYEDVDVMVSHYYPLSTMLPPNYPEEYKDDISSSFYMFDGGGEIDRIKPKYWVFGHMHKHYDFKYNDTELICNPLGYPGENTYTVVKTIELN